MSDELKPTSNPEEGDLTSKKGVRVPKPKLEDVMLQLMQQVQALALEVKELKAKPEPVAVPPVTESVEGDGELSMVEIKPKSTGKYQPRPGMYYEFKGIPGENSGFQPQAKKCMTILCRAAEKLATDKMTLTEEVAMRALRGYQKYVSNNQDAWHVFAYYRGRLIEKGYCRMFQHYGA